MASPRALTGLSTLCLLVLATGSSLAGEYVSQPIEWSLCDSTAGVQQLLDGDGNYVGQYAYGSSAGSTWANAEVWNPPVHWPAANPTPGSSKSVTAWATGVIYREWVPDPNKEVDPPVEETFTASGTGNVTITAFAVRDDVEGTKASADYGAMSICNVPADDPGEKSCASIPYTKIEVPPGLTAVNGNPSTDNFSTTGSITHTGATTVVIRLSCNAGASRTSVGASKDSAAAVSAAGGSVSG